MRYQTHQRLKEKTRTSRQPQQEEKEIGRKQREILITKKP